MMGQSIVYADLQSRSERHADLKIYLGRKIFAALRPVYIGTNVPMYSISD